MEREWHCRQSPSKICKRLLICYGTDELLSKARIVIFSSSANTMDKDNLELTPLHAAAIRKGALRTQEIKDKWKRTKLEIEREIAENGIYPHNSGTVDIKEVCRRAAFTQAALYTPKHRGETLTEIQAWLTAIGMKKQGDVKKNVVSKTDYWKEEHNKIANKIHLYELQLEEKERSIQDMHNRLAAYRAERESKSNIGRFNGGTENAPHANVYPFPAASEDP